MTTQFGTWKWFGSMSPCATSASAITPIVFCASFVPCESASRPLVASWPSRKPRVTRPGRSRPTMRYTTRIAIPATANASSGAISAGTTTLPSRPSPLTAADPSAAKAAPTMPPIRACEELDGRPKYQVARFHAIAPMSPANTIVGVMVAASTIPLATVAATASEMNAPTKLRIAANVTATRGGIARVEIAVATTLAVSWKPLVKSNASAVPTTMTRTMSLLKRPPASRVLDDDALEDVRDRLAGVDRVLEPLVDVLPADHDHRVDPVVEKGRHRPASYPGPRVFEPVHLDREVRDVVEGAQPRHRLGELARALEQHVREALGLLERGLDPVEAEVV